MADVERDSQGRITNYPLKGVLLEKGDPRSPGYSCWVDVSPEAEGLVIGPCHSPEEVIQHPRAYDVAHFFCFRCNQSGSRNQLMEHDCEAFQRSRYGTVRWKVPTQRDFVLGENPWE